MFIPMTLTSASYVHQNKYHLLLLALLATTSLWRSTGTERKKLFYNNNNIDFISGQYPNGANEAVFTIIIYMFTE